MYIHTYIHTYIHVYMYIYIYIYVKFWLWFLFQRFLFSDDVLKLKRIIRLTNLFEPWFTPYALV